MGILGVIFMEWGEALTRVVSDEPVHLREVPTLLFIAGTVQLFFAVTLVVRQGLRGAGDTAWMFVVTTVSSWGVRLPAAYLLGVTAGLGLPGVWIGLCGELVVRGALSVARYLWGGWERKKV
jgi:Na+-driven multidrug efflux pump